MRYQQRMARLVERKIQQTREKLAVLGARDEDDYGLVLPERMRGGRISGI